MAAFQGVFNKFFAEQLRPYGFRKLKGISCFARIVNGEVFHFIKPKNLYPMIRGKKCFNIHAGAMSIYSFYHSYGIDKYTFDNVGDPLMVFVPKEKTELSQDDSLSWGLHYDSDNMQKKIGLSFDLVREYVLPFLDKIQSLNDYIGYCKQRNPIYLKGADKFYGDSPLLILVDDHDDFIDIWKRKCNIILQQSYGGDTENPYYLEDNKRLYQYYIVETAAARDKVYSDPELYAKCMVELERRKETSEERLRDAGLFK